MPDIKLLLFGFGNVGKAFAHLLLRKRPMLSRDFKLDWRVVGIATGRHGAALDPGGIDLESALALVQAGGSLECLSKVHAPDDAAGIIAASGAEVLFENTPVNYETGQPAIDHIRWGLQAGMHAITANKGPIVHAHRMLDDLASSQGRCFLFESAVMDGTPIFSLWRRALPAADLHAFRGVLNSTTNLILSQMEQGSSYTDALAHAQRIGIAETDPRGDTEGWDAAIKVAALVTVLMGIPLTPAQIDRQGIEQITPQEVASAKAQGRRWKLICRAQRRGDGVHASVGPEQIGPQDPLFHLDGTTTAVTFESDVLGSLTITGTNPGPETTAYGLLADLINALREA
ncbi:MAG TPA: homoserine dehydrogenase [Anaerolineae bacterium]|nr:homoserine dehydrogenase [Anaerolineae bacterium]